MSEFIPYARHSISEADIDAVVQVLRSDWLTQGPNVSRFEDAVAEKCRFSSMKQPADLAS